MPEPSAGYLVISAGWFDKEQGLVLTHLSDGDLICDCWDEPQPSQFTGRYMYWNGVSRLVTCSQASFRHPRKHKSLLDTW